jgi:hypothetical protein
MINTWSVVAPQPAIPHLRFQFRCSLFVKIKELGKLVQLEVFGKMTGLYNYNCSSKHKYRRIQPDIMWRELKKELHPELCKPRIGVSSAS